MSPGFGVAVLLLIEQITALWFCQRASICSIRASEFAVKFLLLICTFLQGLLFSADASKCLFLPVGANVNFVSALVKSNSASNRNSPVFLSLLIGRVLGRSGEAQVGNSIVSGVSIDMVNLHSNGDWAISHDPNYPVAVKPVFANQNVLIKMLTLPAFFWETASPFSSVSPIPLNKSPVIFEMTQGSFLPKQEAIFSINRQAFMKKLWGEISVAFGFFGGYCESIVGSHFSGSQVVADVGLGQVSFLDPTHPHFPTSLSQVNS